MISKSLVIGFHGCDRVVAEKIVTGGEELHLSKNPWDWLGYGIYFWEDSYDRADRWAKMPLVKNGATLSRRRSLAPLSTWESV